MADKKLIGATEIDHVENRIKRVSEGFNPDGSKNYDDVAEFVEHLVGVDYYSTIGWAVKGLREDDAASAYMCGLVHGIILGAERAASPMVSFDTEAGRLKQHVIDAEIAENISNAEAGLDK